MATALKKDYVLLLGLMGYCLAHAVFKSQLSLTFSKIVMWHGVWIWILALSFVPYWLFVQRYLSVSARRIEAADTPNSQLKVTVIASLSFLLYLQALWLVGVSGFLNALSFALRDQSLIQLGILAYFGFFWAGNVTGLA